MEGENEKVKESKREKGEGGQLYRSLLQLKHFESALPFKIIIFFISILRYDDGKERQREGVSYGKSEKRSYGEQRKREEKKASCTVVFCSSSTLNRRTLNRLCRSKSFL